MYDNNRGGGRGRFEDKGGRDNSRGGRDGGRAEMFRVTCDGCGDSCEVPFKPTGDKPVYCSHCFRKQNDGGGRDDRGGRGGRFEERGGREERGRRDEFAEKRMYKAICDQCGVVCELPFQPKSDRPVYCSDCFITDDKAKSRKGDDFKIEIDNLNLKLDMIIKFLGISEEKKEAVKIKFVEESSEEVVSEEVEKKEKAPKKEKAVKKIVVKKDK